MTKPDEVEILVHIAAPCRASDDAYFRTLASAYIDFRPASTTNLLDPPTDGSPTAPPAVTETAVLPEVQSLVSEAPPFPSTGDSFASFESVWDNESPRLRVPASAVQDGAADAYSSQPLWQAPQGQTADSDPDDLTSARIFNSSAGVSRHFLSDDARGLDGSIPSDLPAARTPSSSEGPGRSGDVIIPRTSSSTLLKGALPNVANPSTSSGNPIQSSSSPGQSDVVMGLEASGLSIREDRASSSFWQQVQSKRHFATLARSDSEPPLRKRQRLDDGAAGPHAMNRSSSDVGTVKETMKFGKAPLASAAAHLAASLEIWGPEPPVTVDDLVPAQLVTESLEKLAEDLVIEKRFRPAVQKRPLRAFERGHWAVDCSTWGEELSQSAWVFLSNYITNGHAGWGVWCRRAEDWSSMKVYCWGAVVGHVYLLLYMVSQRKILSTGGSWIGGDGDPLVVLEIRET